VPTSIRTKPVEVLVVHANALLTPRGRLELAETVVEDGWPLRRAAERFQVSVPTAQRWAQRYRQRDLSVPAIEAMKDRSSRPRRSPHQTRPVKVRKILHLRAKRGWGPARIGHKLGLAPSTVNRVLRREGVPRLNQVDLATRRQIRGQIKRYEHAAPGDLVHVDVKKLGKIPDGGGHRIHGRRAARGNSRLMRSINTTTTGARGYGYVHTALDDHSRLAYSEVLADETAATATAWWRRAIAWFRAQGVTITAVLSDNGSCYRSNLWRTTCVEHAIKHRRTRPYRPQTNGKVERFHRTLAVEW
jgi:transposase InsO family protein